MSTLKLSSAMSWLRLCLSFVFISGCSGSSDDSEPVTYRGQVTSVLNKHCTRCHFDGGQGSADFTQYDIAKALAPTMISKIETGQMPPPASDPDCRDYEQSDALTITDEEKSIIQRWIDDGYLEGDTELPGPRRDDSSLVLEDANLEVQIDAPYTPSFSDENNPGNEYRCFPVEHGQTDPFYITAMHPKVDQRSIVHHIVLFKVSQSDVPNNIDPTEGFDCIDMAFFGGAEAITGLVLGQGAGSGMLAGWAPGLKPVEFDDGYGVLVKPDEILLIQMHYYQSNPDENVSDQTGYSFRIQTEIENELIMLPVGPTDFTIPAGSENYEVNYDVPSTPISLKVHGVFPHMHYLGSGYHMRIEEDGQETCLVRSEHYDFNNQQLYMFTNPVDMPAGSMSKISCTFDNSDNNPELLHDPPIDVSYGERTDEEMCFGFTLLSLK